MRLSNVARIEMRIRLVAKEVLDKTENFEAETLSGIKDAKVSIPLECDVSDKDQSSSLPFHWVESHIWSSQSPVVTSPSNSVVFWNISLTPHAGAPSLRWLNPSDITKIFDQKPELRELVNEAYGQLSSRFDGAQLTLRSSSDPAEECPDTLVIKVSTTLEYDAADQLWQSFNEEWWLPNYDRSEDRLSILLDF